MTCVMLYLKNSDYQLRKFSLNILGPSKNFP